MSQDGNGWGGDDILFERERPFARRACVGLPRGGWEEGEKKRGG